MLSKLRSRFTYANVMATIAVFLALGGTVAYAAPRVFSSNIVDGEVKTPDLADGAVTTPKVADRVITSRKLATMPAARAQKIPSQLIPPASFDRLTFETESFDTANLHNNATNNSRLTAPIAGIYQISAGVAWEFRGDTTSGDRSLSLVVNGSISPMAGTNDRATSGSNSVQSVSTLAKLAANDYVEAAVALGDTGPLYVFGYDSTFLAMHWVGPG